MNLGRLKEIIDMTIAVNPTAKECEVTVIVNGEDSIGATPSVGIRSAGKGFDWDGHMFMLRTEVPIYRKQSK